MHRSLLVLVLALTVAPVSRGQIVRSPDLRLQFHRAERAYRTGSSPHEAKSRLDVVLKALPNDTEARMLRARVLLDLDRPEDALADARHAVSLEPTNGLAHLLVCETAIAAGQREEASAALDAAASSITDGADLHIRLSYNAELLGDLDRAEAYARLARTLDPSLPGAFRQLGRVFVAKGRIQAATTLVAEGLELGVLAPSDIRADAVLAVLVDRPELADWFD